MAWVGAIVLVYDEIAVKPLGSSFLYDFNNAVAHVIGKPRHTCKEAATYELCSPFRKVAPGVIGRVYSGIPTNGPL